MSPRTEGVDLVSVGRDEQPVSAASRLYRLYFDVSVADQWHLSDPVDLSGEPVDSDFLEGRHEGRLEFASEFVFPIYVPGRPLDFTFYGRIPVVTERIGSLLGELAGSDLQRLPARVQSMEGRYEVLNVLPKIDCVDRERTVAQVLVKGDPQPVKNGTLASLAPFLANKSLYDCVYPGDMRLKTADIGWGRIFRVKGWELWPVVTEDIKEALEAQGTTGLEYRLVS